MHLKSGKDLVFFTLLEAQAETAHRASTAFLALVRDFPHAAAHCESIAGIERQGDEQTRGLQNRVASTFITPLDKEDLRDLSQSLDDITDTIEATAARIGLYRIEEARPDLEPLAVLLTEATAAVHVAVGEIRNGFGKSSRLIQALEEIHAIENRCDRAFRDALESLFHSPGIEVLTVIKWKEIYDRVETAADKCEDVAKIIGTVLVKYA